MKVQLFVGILLMAGRSGSEQMYLNMDISIMGVPPMDPGEPEPNNYPDLYFTLTICHDISSNYCHFSYKAPVANNVQSSVPFPTLSTVYVEDHWAIKFLYYDEDPEESQDFKLGNAVVEYVYLIWDIKDGTKTTTSYKFRYGDGGRADIISWISIGAPEGELFE